ncbi:DUF4179 domain-containing protein [Salinimicrobium sp. GXAS 041]|uniref:DUF4179 domain-containing protein n=1 Tax=Salinimicrobium sp. GXAS 041 TaxID=3400806 RepID=UPI003C71D725
MKNDNIEELFSSLDFDVAEPSQGHEKRFEEKLQQRSRKKIRTSGVISLWGPALSIAASLLIAFLVFQKLYSNQLNREDGLASVSTEMKTTQDFYSSVISKELYNLQQEKTPETAAVIEDALKQLQILEKDYEKLKTDLSNSGQDKRVISAMITNFQRRIDLLNNVLEKVNNINKLKNTHHENNIL